MHKNVQHSLSFQKERYKSNEKNGTISLQKFNSHISLSKEQTQLLGLFIQKGTLTARSANKITRIARTIADIEQSQYIHSKHITQALQLRYNLSKLQVTGKNR